MAASLAQGRAWAQDTLGATPVDGGAHALMGTHNAWLAIGSEAYPRSHLEIIAIDPGAPVPARSRWFEMDSPALQAAVQQGPRLVGYAARSPQIDMHRWGLMNSMLMPGPILKARQLGAAGEWMWQAVVRDDGQRLAGGAVPVLVQWPGELPADRLPASGVQLLALTVRGLSLKAATVLRLRPLQRLDEPGAAIEARLLTPRGEVTLRSA